MTLAGKGLSRLVDFIVALDERMDLYSTLARLSVHKKLHA